jgi:hypothetical protein
LSVPLLAASSGFFSRTARLARQDDKAQVD